VDIWRIIADRKIKEAMDEGAFDNLEGAGRPLALDENPYEDPAERMAHRLMKNNGLAPGWIEEARELDAEARRLQEDHGRCTDAEFRRRAAALNRRIAAFNLKTPVHSTQKRMIHG